MNRTPGELAAKYPRVPSLTIGGIIRYVDQNVPAGNFLRAVLSNNLREALATADDANSWALKDIVNLLYNEVPSSCWGSEEKYLAHLAKRKTDE